MSLLVSSSQVSGYHHTRHCQEFIKEICPCARIACSGRMWKVDKRDETKCSESDTCYYKVLILLCLRMFGWYLRNIPRSLQFVSHLKVA